MSDFLKTISALNDETRVLILKFLIKNGKSCVCELESSFDMIQSRLSRHLKILKEAGFLSVEKSGTWSYYYIDCKSELNHDMLNSLKKIDIDIPKKIPICRKD